MPIVFVSLFGAHKNKTQRSLENASTRTSVIIHIICEVQAEGAGSFLFVPALIALVDVLAIEDEAHRCSRNKSNL